MKTVYVTEKNINTIAELPVGTKIRAYKVVEINYSPIYRLGTLKTIRKIRATRYYVGTEHRIKRWNSDPNVACGAGLNVATKKWCFKNYNYTLKVGHLLVVEFNVEDIVCMPVFGQYYHEKFRVKRFKVIKELTKKRI